jgi:hydrogenase nickel insertion protein HypA
MHEVSLLENTLELALDYARQHNATQIHHLTLRVGQLSGVIPEALQFAFDIVVQGTIAQTATLSIESIPAIWIVCRLAIDFDRPFKNCAVSTTLFIRTVDRVL